MRRLDLRADRHHSVHMPVIGIVATFAIGAKRRADTSLVGLDALCPNRFVTGRVQRLYSGTARRALAVSGALVIMLYGCGGCIADERLCRAFVDVADGLSWCLLAVLTHRDLTSRDIHARVQEDRGALHARSRSAGMRECRGGQRRLGALNVLLRTGSGVHGLHRQAARTNSGQRYYRHPILSVQD